MAQLSVQVGQGEAEAWMKRLKYEPQPGGWWRAPNGTRAMWRAGSLWINVADSASATMLVGLRLAFKKEPKPDAKFPTEVEGAIGGPITPPAPPTEPAAPASPPIEKPILGKQARLVTKADTAVSALDRAASPATTETSPAPSAPSPDPTPSGETAVDALDRAASVAAPAPEGDDVEDAPVGIEGAMESTLEELEGAAASAERKKEIAQQAEAAAKRVAEERAAREQARAAEAAKIASAREDLAALGIEVGGAQAITEGYVIRAQVGASIRLSRTVAHHFIYTKTASTLPPEAMTVFLSTRRAITRAIDSAGGTDFLGMKVIPLSGVKPLIGKLKALEEGFRNRVKTEIVPRRDEFNAHLVKAIREEEGEDRVITPDDLIPEDFDKFVRFDIVALGVAIPEPSAFRKAGVGADDAAVILDGIYRMAQRDQELDLLSRMDKVLRALADAFSLVANGQRMNPSTRAAIERAFDMVEKADAGRTVTVRAQLDKAKALFNIIKEADAAGGFENAAPAIASNVERIAQVSAAEAKVTGGITVAPDTSTPEKALASLTKQLKADMQANEEHFGVAKDGRDATKIGYSSVPDDGTPISTAKAIRALANQFGRFTGEAPITKRKGSTPETAEVLAEA